MLDVQGTAVEALLGAAGGERLSVLEVGGGHGQLTGRLLADGHGVVIHGSHLVCHRGLAETARLVSDLWRLPFPDRSFDLVVAIRLLPHVVRWRELLNEMKRVSRRLVMVDFPVRGTVHRLAPFLFRWKKKLEGNTRPYFDYSPGEVSEALLGNGWTEISTGRQFFWPMVLHRAVNWPRVSQWLEAIARSVGLSRLFGSPCIMMAQHDGGQFRENRTR